MGIGNRRMTQHVLGPNDGGAAVLCSDAASLIAPPLGLLARPCEGDQLPANWAEQGAGRLAVRGDMAEVAVNGGARWVPHSRQAGQQTSRGQGKSRGAGTRRRSVGRGWGAP
ncbi:protein of unknown function [Caballeronia sp. S22]